MSTLAGIEAVKIWSVHYLVSTYWLESVDSVGNMSASSVHWCWVTQVYWAALRCPALKWPVSSSSWQMVGTRGPLLMESHPISSLSSTRSSTGLCAVHLHCRVLHFPPPIRIIRHSNPTIHSLGLNFVQQGVVLRWVNYIALSFSLKVTKISAHEDRALHLYDIAMADVTLGLIYTYLIFVIFLHARILSHTNLTLGKCVNLRHNCFATK